MCKEFGKAKVYIANQDHFPETSNEELEVLDKEIAAKKNILDDMKDQIKKLNA